MLAIGSVFIEVQILKRGENHHGNHKEDAYQQHRKTREHQVRCIRSGFFRQAAVSQAALKVTTAKKQTPAKAIHAMKVNSARSITAMRINSARAINAKNVC
jgi:hypothetical protein